MTGREDTQNLVHWDKQIENHKDMGRTGSYDT